MSKIDELIKLHCPDGVEYRKLGDVCEISKGKQLNKELLQDNGKFPAYNGGVTYSGFTNSYNVKENTTIISQGGASAGYVQFIKCEFWANAHCYYLTPSYKEVNNKYIYYFVKMKQDELMAFQHGAGIPALKVDKILKLDIPIPPLEVQSEVVKILDNFTELEAELEAELLARKKQYEYYREELLTFDDEPNGANLPNEPKEKKVEWKSLGEVTQYSPERISCSLLNETNYIGVDNLLPDKQGKSLSNYVPNIGNCTQYNKNDILIGNIRPYLKKIWLANNDGGASGDVLVINITQSNINARYLYYLLSSDQFFHYNMQHAKGAKMPRGSKSMIMLYQIPVPPLAEQERIIGILDKFEDLVNDISVGLPAELIARRKQYEYYRDKLLTFKERV